MSFFSVECKEQSLNKLLVKRMSKCISVKGYNLGNLNIGLLIIWGPGFEQMGSIRISERNRCEVLGKNSFHLKIIILNIVRRHFSGRTIIRGCIRSNNSFDSLMSLVYKGT